MKQKVKESYHVNVECKNCGHQFSGNYCNNCGQIIISERNTIRNLIGLLFNSFDFNKGLLYTVRMLLVNPGKIINEYLNGRTKDYQNPLRYLFIIVGISALLTIWTNVFDTTLNTTNELFDVTEDDMRFQGKVISFMRKYLNVIAILFIPFYSIISKWLFRKYKQYYAEHLIINSYLYAQYALLNFATFVLILAFPSLIEYVYFMGVFVFVSYYTYALKSIYQLSIFKALVNAILINLLGFFLIMLFSMSLMVLFMIIIKLSGFNLEQVFG